MSPDEKEAVTVVTGVRQSRPERYPLQSSIESECERIAWRYGDSARWDVRCSRAVTGGWAAIAVIMGPCRLRDANAYEREHGQIYRCVATDPDECWTRAEAETRLLALLVQV